MEWFQYLLGSQSKKQQLCSWEIVWPQPTQLQAPGICLKACFYLAKQQSEGKQENPQLNTGIFVINWNMSCVDTHVHTGRFLLSQEFNNQTKGRAAQRALPSWCFRAGHCAGPSAHALENFKGMEEWESTDTEQSSEQSLPTSTAQKRSCYPTGTAGHGTACPRHSRQFSPTALLNPTLFWSSQRIYPLKCAQKATTAPAFQSQTNSPSTAQVSSPSSISVIASPLDFLSHSCTVITGSTTPS